ncbi:MAG: 50S ribosomal protein L10 [Thermodesulfobacteriota bacterium]
MERSEKKVQIEELKGRFEKADATFLADYTGIKAEGMTALRKSLRESAAEFKISKNTLTRLAIKGTSSESLSEHFKGPVAVAFSYKDAAATAKVLTEFAKSEPNFEMKVGVLGDRVMDLAEIKGLASLPSREELLARLVGVLNNVPTGLVRVLGGVPLKLLYALNAIGETKKSA